MDPKAFAATTGGATSASDDICVSDNVIALKADLAGLAESVQRLAAESPQLARESFESSIRHNPIQATFIAAGVGFVLSLVLVR